MGETTKKTVKRHFFRGVVSEFKKVVWPDKNSVLKQTIAVILLTAALGVIIKLLDLLIQYGLSFIA